MTTPRVKLYALSTCGHCRAVKDLLARQRADVEVVDVDRLDRDERRQTLETVKPYNERLSFPMTVIGDRVIVGYKADEIRKALDDARDAAETDRSGGTSRRDG